MIIRDECDNDILGIDQVIESAFKGKAFSDGSEAGLVHKLRREEALAVSLVAEDQGVVIGQACFSPALLSGNAGAWFALGPIAVIPERQRQGVGGQLLETGLKQLRKLNASGCILVGDPGYYSRHAFIPAPQHCPPNEPATHFQLINFSDTEPVGIFEFHSAFYC